MGTKLFAKAQEITEQLQKHPLEHDYIHNQFHTVILLIIKQIKRYLLLV